MYVRLFRRIEKDSRVSLHLVTTDKCVKFDEIPASDNLMRSRQLVSRSLPQDATCRRNVIIAEGYYDANTRVVAFATFILGFILATFIFRFSALEIKRGIPPLIYYEEEVLRILTYSRRDSSRSIISFCCFSLFGCSLLVYRCLTNCWFELSFKNEYFLNEYGFFTSFISVRDKSYPIPRDIIPEGYAVRYAIREK